MFTMRLFFGALALCPLLSAGAQVHDHNMTMPVTGAEMNEHLHMEMSPARTPTRADSLRAANVAGELRAALAPFADTSAAVAAGYKMFLPQLKEQKVYHFTNNWNALKEAFRFDPATPTSLLYKKDASGHFVLVGAMYTAPKRFSVDKLDARIPLSIARWHKHVNWCLPKRGDDARWAERQNGQPLFGPESPVATQAACDAVGGVFHESIFGWMLHANVLQKDIWADDHMMSERMTGGQDDRMTGGQN